MEYLTAGDSHGKYVIGILNGFPKGVDISNEYIKECLRKRRCVYGRSKRQIMEDDEFEIISGLWDGKTTGMPIGIIVKNRRLEYYPDVFIPLHGEFYAGIKYKSKKYSVYRERLSQRESVVRVALFSFTRRFLEKLGIEIESRVVSCYGVENQKEFKEIIDSFDKTGESFGGVFELRVKNIMSGIGGFSQGVERLQSKLSSQIFSIGSIKGIEFGAGFQIEKYTSKDLRENPRLLGGIEGGMTRGDDIVIRCVTRPLSATKSIDSKNLSDITSVFAAGYISEFIVSYVLADEIMKKFGCDVFDDIEKAYMDFKKG